MTNVTVLLVVLSLTGAPAANAACANWCESASTSCCDVAVAATPAAPLVADGDCTCAAAMSERPTLVPENRGARQTTVMAAVLPTRCGPGSVSLGIARLETKTHVPVTRDVPLLVLRL
jgi:hypothetical protein